MPITDIVSSMPVTRSQQEVVRFFLSLLTCDGTMQLEWGQGRCLSKQANGAHAHSKLQ